MHFLSELGDKNGVGLVMLLTKHFRPDKEAITTDIVLAFSSALNTLDKMFWRAPRPYFLTRMTPLNCKDIEFGNPSGHAMVTTAVWLTAFHLMEGKGLKYRLVQVLIYSIVALITFNRFQMGVHSLDQLLNGCV